MEFHLAGFDLGKVENIVDQHQQCLGGTGGNFHILPGIGFQFTAIQQLQHAQYAIHGGAQFVADGGGKYALGPGGVEGNIAGPDQFLLAVFQLVHHGIEGVFHALQIHGTVQVGAHADLAAFGLVHGGGQGLQWTGEAIGDGQQQ